MFKPTCMAALFLTTLCAKVDAAVLFVDATNLRSQNGMVWRNDYFVGEDGGLEWRSVLEFDLSGISDAIISANLELVRYNFASSASAETLNVFDSTTSPSSPAMGSSFGDLGSGTAYGTASISSAGAPGDLVNIPLNPSALSDLNAALGNPFFLGLASGSLNGSLSGGKDGIFEASSAAGIQRLVLTFADPVAYGVPEPKTALLLCLGSAMLRGFSRRLPAKELANGPRARRRRRHTSRF